MPSGQYVYPLTDTGSLKRIRSANSTATSFAARVPTTTKPTGDGVIDSTGGLSYVLLTFFGRDAADETFAFRVMGWSQVIGAAKSLWVPVRLLQARCTLSTATGVADSEVTASEFIVDTIATVTGSTMREVVSPGDNAGAAHAILDTTGFEIVTVDFDLITAAQANGLYRWF